MIVVAPVGAATASALCKSVTGLTSTLAACTSVEDALKATVAVNATAKNSFLIVVISILSFFFINNLRLVL